MGDGLTDHDRTNEFAAQAMDSLRQHGLPLSPLNYEVWYVHASGQNPTLSAELAAILSNKGRIGEEDLEALFETHLAPLRAGDRLSAAGSGVAKQIDDVMALIAEALGSSNAFGDNLSAQVEKLTDANDRETVFSIVDALVHSTRTMQENNKTLESRLIASREEITTLQESLETARAESLIDPLTGLGNRKYFDRSIEEAVTAATQTGEPMSLLMLDIDHFKSFNDNFGHLTGDQVLRLLALALKHNIKGKDVAARYGGEEFAIVLPGTALHQAVTVADQIRAAVTARELKKKSTGEFLGRITVSVGVATYAAGDTVTSLIQRADSCLYAAKAQGRNRVISEADSALTFALKERVA